MVKKYTCQNGVRVVLENIPTVRSVSIGVWVMTGSRNENKTNNGISHFIEHMFFKGTKTRSARDIAESFDSIGGQVNAFTSKENTCFYAKVLDTHADMALDVLADMFFNSVFSAEEIVKEKSVVLEEIKMYEDAPDDIVHDLLSEAIYKDHPLGYPILGRKETLDTFSEETIRTYMSEQYIPENVVISIAGNITDAFIKKVEAYFGTYETGKKAEETTEPIFHAKASVRKKETEQAHLCIGYEGLEVAHPDMYHLIVLNNILGGNMSSRLFQEVREAQGLAYSVYSYHAASQDSGFLTIYAGTGAEQLDTLFETIQATVETLKTGGVTNKEVMNNKEQLKGSLMLSLESTNSRMSRNGRNELILKRHRTLDEVVDLIDAVDTDGLHRLIENIFTADYASAIVSPSGNLPLRLKN